MKYELCVISGFPDYARCHNHRTRAAVRAPYLEDPSIRSRIEHCDHVFPSGESCVTNVEFEWDGSEHSLGVGSLRLCSNCENSREHEDRHQYVAMSFHERSPFSSLAYIY